MNTHKNIDTVCPYCGSGCVITCTVDTETNRVIEAKGSPEGVNNEGRLCLKGLYGWDYLNDPQILTKRIRHPMIRKGGKQSPLVEVSWQEAIEYTASRRGHHQRVWPRRRHGGRFGPRSGQRNGLYYSEIHARRHRHQ